MLKRELEDENRKLKEELSKIDDRYQMLLKELADNLTGALQEINDEYSHAIVDMLNVCFAGYSSEKDILRAAFRLQVTFATMKCLEDCLMSGGFDDEFIEKGETPGSYGLNNYALNEFKKYETMFVTNDDMRKETTVFSYPTMIEGRLLSSAEEVVEKFLDGRAF